MREPDSPNGNDAQQASTPKLISGGGARVETATESASAMPLRHCRKPARQMIHGDGETYSPSSCWLSSNSWLSSTRQQQQRGEICAIIFDLFDRLNNAPKIGCDDGVIADISCNRAAISRRHIATIASTDANGVSFVFVTYV